MPEPLTYEELQLEIAEQEKALTDFKVEYQKYLEEQAKIKADSDKTLNEQFEKYLKANDENSKQITTLTGEIDDLKQLIANENSIDSQTYTYKVEVSDDQIAKLKKREEFYQDWVSVIFTCILGVMFAYVGVKGAFSHWKI